MAFETQKNIFPFSQAQNIEIISYKNRYEFDTAKIGDLVISGKLNIPESDIKERVLLNEADRSKLFDILFIEEGDDIGFMCFNPRHSIVFYDVAYKIIAYLEVCLECGTERASEGFIYKLIGISKMNSLSAIFKDAGVTYFGEDEKL